MKFSIGHMLMVFPAFLIAIFCVFASGPNMITPVHFRAKNTIFRLQQQVERAREAISVSTDVVDQWLSGNLPPTHPASRYLYGPAEKDPWGNHFKAVPEVETSGEEIKPIKIYSVGRDSKSRTNGNDPDDVNLWDSDCGEIYSHELDQFNRREFFTNSLILTPFVYVGMLCCGYVFRSIAKKLKGLAKPD